MHRSLPMKSRCLTSLLVAAGVAVTTAAHACPDSRSSGVSATIPSAEPEIVLAANTNQDASSDAPAPVPSSPHARLRESEHLLDMSWLFITSGPKNGAHLSGAERVSRPIDHKGAWGGEAARGHTAAAARHSAPHWDVGRPHRMPGPEIL